MAELFETGIQWGIPGILALVFAIASLKRIKRLEDRLNTVEDYRATTMADIINKNTESQNEVATAIKENSMAIDKLRTHCMITAKVNSRG